MTQEGLIVELAQGDLTDEHVQGGRLMIVLKGVVSKFWNYFYLWSDLTEIFTYVKLKKKHNLFVQLFRLGRSFTYI